jgi:hypothetical protein
MNILSSTALAAALLTCGAASAQPAPAPPPAQTAPAADAVIEHTLPANGDGVQHIVVSNAPVADTPENRAKYGKPMSHAGRRTKPIGD